MVEVSVMKLLDRCIQQDLGKNGNKKKNKAFGCLVRFLEDLGKTESEKWFML